MRNDAGMPMTNGVGANRSCSAQLMQVGKRGITKMNDEYNYFAVIRR